MKKKIISIITFLIAIALVYYGYQIEPNTPITKDNENAIIQNESIVDDDTSKSLIMYEFRSASLLDSHYEKHKDEFDHITKEEYLNGAINLINMVSNSVITKTEDDGDLMFFDTETNEFSVLSTDGFIRTYFIPTDGINYFNRK